MLDYLLPIGSVVKLRNGKKKVMIYGVKQTDAKTDTTYDYVGVLYPEGNIGQEYQLLFSHDAIEEIYFRGYENEERLFCNQKVNIAYEKLSLSLALIYRTPAVVAVFVIFYVKIFSGVLQ